MILSEQKRLQVTLTTSDTFSLDLYTWLANSARRRTRRGRPPRARARSSNGCHSELSNSPGVRSVCSSATTALKESAGSGPTTLVYLDGGYKNGLHSVPVNTRYQSVYDNRSTESSTLPAMIGTRANPKSPLQRFSSVIPSPIDDHRSRQSS